jgi:hypothetical protein
MCIHSNEKTETEKARFKKLLATYPADFLNEFPLANDLQELDSRVWTSDMRTLQLSVEQLATLERTTNTNENKKELTSALRAQNILRDKDEDKESIIDIYRPHIVGCFNGLNALLNNTSAFIHNPSWKDIKSRDIPNTFENYITEINEDEDAGLFLRFVVLYHDIGKVFHRDKHPALGKHVLESLDDNQRHRFLQIMNTCFGDESKFYELLEVVAYHDLFGTLCTGEASRVALINASGLRMKKVEDASRLLTYLAIANLADMYGSVGDISLRIVQNVLSDWYYMITTFGLGKREADRVTSKADIEKIVVESQQEPERTVERIKRMHLTAIFESNIIKDQKWREVLAAKITDDVVRSALSKHLGPQVKDFCARYALVCKLDYAKRFMNALSDAWIKKEIERLTQSEENQEYENVMNSIRIAPLSAVVVAVLVRLVRCYYDQSIPTDSDAKRIGVELMGLIRSPRIIERVIKLLLSDGSSEGVNWIADEATAFYFL